MSNLMAVKYRYLGQYTGEEIIQEINSMEQEGILIANDRFIMLTNIGEESIYGTFDINHGVNELMGIFQQFHVGRNQSLPIGSLLAVKHESLSPQTNKYLKDVLTEAENRGYITEGQNNSILLTDAGFEYLN